MGLVLALVLLSSLAVIFINFQKITVQGQMVSPPISNNPVRSVGNECKLNEVKQPEGQFYVP